MDRILIAAARTEATKQNERLNDKYLWAAQVSKFVRCSINPSMNKLGLWQPRGVREKFDLPEGEEGRGEVQVLYLS